MSMHESSSDGPKNVNEFSGASENPSYTGEIPDLTIGPDKDSGHSDNAQQHATPQVEEPTVMDPDKFAPERKGSSSDRPKTAADVGKTATPPAVEVTEPEVTLPDRTQETSGTSPKQPFRLVREEVVGKRDLNPAEQYYSNAGQKTKDTTSEEGDNPTDKAKGKKEGDDLHKEFTEASKIRVIDEHERGTPESREKLRDSIREKLAAAATRDEVKATNVNTSSDNAPDTTSARGTGTSMPSSKQAGVDLGTDETQIFDKYAAEALENARKFTYAPQEQQTQAPTIDTVAAEIDKRIDETQTPNEPVRETTNQSSLGGLLDHEEVTAPPKFSVPNDVVAEPATDKPATVPIDVVAEPTKFTIPTDVVARQQWVRETNSSQDPRAATPVEVIPTGRLLDILPDDMRNDIRKTLAPPIIDVDPATAQSQEAATLGHDPEAGASVATDEGAAPNNTNSEPFLPDEVDTVAPGTVVNEAKHLGTFALNDVHDTHKSDTGHEAQASETTEPQAAATADSDLDPTGTAAETDASPAISEIDPADAEAPEAAPLTEITEPDTEAADTETPLAETDPATQEPEPTETPAADAEAPSEAANVSDAPQVDAGTQSQETPVRPSANRFGRTPQSSEEPQPPGTPQYTASDSPLGGTQNQSSHNATRASTNTYPSSTGPAKDPNQNEPRTTPEGGARKLDEAPLTDETDKPDLIDRIQRMADWFTGADKPTYKDAADGLLDPDEIYDYAKPSPAARTGSAVLGAGLAAASPFRAPFARIDGVEKIHSGLYVVRMRNGRTIRVEAGSEGWARFKARFMSVLS